MNLPGNDQNNSSAGMTVGSPLKTITAFAVPLVLGNLLQQLYNMVDTMVVGRFVGTRALAAVGATGPVVQLLLGLIIGLTTGLSLVIAKKAGAGDRRAIRKNIVNGLYLTLTAGILITVLGLVFGRNLFGLINTSPELMEDALEYSYWIFAGALATAVYNYEAAVLRAFGNSVVPLIFLAVSSVLNIGLDLFFVISLDLGIAGAAAATVLSQLISCVLCFLYMRKLLKKMEFTVEDFKPSGDILKEHLKTGTPMAFFQSMLSVSFLVSQSALNTLGTNQIAAYTAAYKMDTLVMQILAAFGTAVSTFAAQNYGGGNEQRVRKGARDCLKVTVLISLAAAGLVFLFGDGFMTLFVDSSEVEVISLGVQYIKFTSLFYVVLGVNFVIRFVLTGVGQAAVPLGVGIMEICVRVGCTYLLIYPLGFTGMTYTNPLCWVTSTLAVALVYLPLMKRAFRKRAKEEDAGQEAFSVQEAPPEKFLEDRA